MSRALVGMALLLAGTAVAPPSTPGVENPAQAHVSGLAPQPSSLAPSATADTAPTPPPSLHEDFLYNMKGPASPPAPAANGAAGTGRAKEVDKQPVSDDASKIEQATKLAEESKAQKKIEAEKKAKVAGSKKTVLPAEPAPRANVETVAGSPAKVAEESQPAYCVIQQYQDALSTTVSASGEVAKVVNALLTSSAAVTGGPCKLVGGISVGSMIGPALDPKVGDISLMKAGGRWTAAQAMVCPHSLVATDGSCSTPSGTAGN